MKINKPLIKCFFSRKALKAEFKKLKLDPKNANLIAFPPERTPENYGKIIKANGFTFSNNRFIKSIIIAKYNNIIPVHIYTFDELKPDK